MSIAPGEVEARGGRKSRLELTAAEVTSTTTTTSTHGHVYHYEHYDHYDHYCF